MRLGSCGACRIHANINGDGGAALMSLWTSSRGGSWLPHQIMHINIVCFAKCCRGPRYNSPSNAHPSLI